MSVSVTEVHWRIIANLGLKFRSQCARGACGREGRDHRREEWRDHLALCYPLLGPLFYLSYHAGCSLGVGEMNSRGCDCVCPSALEKENGQKVKA